MSVTIEKLIEDFELEVLVEGDTSKEITINDINRPGLQLAGFYNYFEPKRIQVIGKAELSFLNDMQIEQRKKRLAKYFSNEMTCVIIARGLEVQEEFIELARKHNSLVLRSKLSTTKLISKLTMYLASKLAPETRLHGVLLDVYGIGILVTGESGIGKSETALELIKRGHRLVTDDAVDIREIDGELIGTSPDITMGMLEVRGIGIIDVSALYGLSSTIPEKSISFVMHFEHWKDDGDYDRLGTDNEYVEILGVKVKKLTLPVRTGRNIAVLIEAAAANYRYSLLSDTSPIEIIERRIDNSINK